MKRIVLGFYVAFGGLQTAAFEMQNVQPGLGDVRGQLIVIALEVNVPGPSYTRGGRDETLVFAGEPTPVTVRLRNSSDRRVLLGRDQQHWSDALALTVTPLTAQRSDAAPPRMLRLGSAPQRGVEEVGAERGVSARFAIESADGAPLSIGRYQISVALDPGALDPAARAMKNILRRDQVIEVREPQTDNERMDYFLAVAYRLSSSGAVVEARQWDEAVLTMNVDSIPALSDLLFSFLRDGNCASAKPLLTRLLEIVNSERDPAWRHSRNAREDIAVNSAAHFRKQCPG